MAEQCRFTWMTYDGRVRCQLTQGDGHRRHEHRRLPTYMQIWSWPVRYRRVEGALLWISADFEGDMEGEWLDAG